MPDITQLYPVQNELPLQGAYLAHDLRKYAVRLGHPFVYANFINSLDGRIAVSTSAEEGLMVPSQTVNDRDWRLFQELAAQADLVISSGRYLREWAEGKAQEILRVDDPAFADLAEWRVQHSLSPFPDIAIISRTLDFPIPPVLTALGRKVVVFTTEQADQNRVAEIESEAGRVVRVGKKNVEGQKFLEAVGILGYRTVYSAAGPRILYMLLNAKVLTRLYLTFAHRILGGKTFSTIMDGELLPTAANFELNSLYLDPHGLSNGPCESTTGQMFASYTAVYSDA